MSDIRARWEWRVFDAPRHAVKDALARAEENQSPDERSDEIYIVSRVSPHNVKVRGGQLDVKLLEATGDAGLEQWRPVLKTRFPLAASDLAPVWHAWAITPPRRLDAPYPLERFLREVVAAIPSLRAIPVTKHRTRILLDGCRGEHARIEVDGRELTTIAFEDEAPARVLAAVRAAGLESLPTSSYPAALKAAVGLTRPSTPSPRVSV